MRMKMEMKVQAKVDKLNPDTAMAMSLLWVVRMMQDEMY